MFLNLTSNLIGRIERYSLREDDPIYQSRWSVSRQCIYKIAISNVQFASAFRRRGASINNCAF